MKRTPSKETAAYWRSRVQLLPYKDSQGKTHPGTNYAIRLQAGGLREYFALGTSNKEQGAERAREIYALVRAGRVEEARTRFSGRRDIAPQTGLTVGQYLALVREKGGLLGKTLANYENCLKTILSEILNVPKGRERFSYRTPGNSAWQERIFAEPLGTVTTEKIQAWRQRRISEAGSSPKRRQSAVRTVNTYIRCARSLFSDGLLAKLGTVELPSPAPFRGIKLDGGGSMRYQSKINVELLIAAARAELKKERPEAYKAFLLALFAGLRRGEIDALEWSMVDLGNRVIHLENTDFLHLKTDDSHATVDLDAELVDELRLLLGSSSGGFVIVSPLPPRAPGSRPYYRCAPVFAELADWLRSKGVQSNKPIHELRKELGAIVASDRGIYAAGQLLRHSDITTTARHYADRKQRISAGLGTLLTRKIEVVAAG